MNQSNKKKSWTAKILRLFRCGNSKKQQNKQLNTLIRDELEDYHFRLLLESNRISRVNVTKIKEKIEQEKSEEKTVQYRRVSIPTDPKTSKNQEVQKPPPDRRTVAPPNDSISDSRRTLTSHSSTGFSSAAGVTDISSAFVGTETDDEKRQKGSVSFGTAETIADSTRSILKRKNSTPGSTRTRRRSTRENSGRRPSLPKNLEKSADPIRRTRAQSLSTNPSPLLRRGSIISSRASISLPRTESTKLRVRK